MTETSGPSQPASPRQLARDAARIRSEIAGSDGGIDPFIAAVRTTRMPMLITDPRRPDNPIVFVNDSFCRMSGYGREEVLGRNCRFLQGPETDPEAVAAIRAAVATPRPIEIDIRNHRKDGTPFWNRLLLAPVNDAAGRLAYFFASQIDVTAERDKLAELEAENRAARRRLQWSEASFQLATEAAEIGTWDLDLVTDELTWSDRTRAMFGISPGVPCSMRDFYAGLHPEDREATAAAFAAAIDPERRATYDVEYRTVGKEDGLVRWVAAKGRGLFDERGRGVRAIGTAIDITARKAAETNLRFQLALNDRLRDAGDPLGVKRTASAALGRHLGVNRAGWAHLIDDGRAVSVQQDWTDGTARSLAGHGRALDAFGPEVAATLRAGRTLVVGDDRADPRTASPGYREAWDSIGTRAMIVVPMLRGGDLAGLFYIHADAPRVWSDDEVALTEEVAVRTWSAYAQAEAEAALRELNATLEERVAARTAELEHTHEALRQAQKMEAVGQLTGGVAHDFNNLLTIIRSSVDFLRRPDLPESRKGRYLDAVSDTVERAAKLTSQLLAFARRQALKPEIFEVGARLRTVADLLDTVTGSRVRIVTDLPDEACFIRADPNQFETALVNMAVNARDAMAENGTLTIALRCGAPLPPIRGHLGSAEHFAAISVGDTGSGILPENMSRIFEPFFTTKSVGKGTGLGLSQVFGFAKQSGGDVNVVSVPGEGATFTLYLPQVAPEAESAGPDAAPAEPAPVGRGQRVLVVEDNVEVGRFATQILEDFGFVTSWAANAEEALEVLGPEGDGYDVVFSDVVMPGMGGLALAEELKRRVPGLPVILASGYSHVLAAEGTHGFELLHKPYSAEELGRLLGRVAGRSART